MSFGMGRGSSMARANPQNTGVRSIPPVGAASRSLRTTALARRNRTAALAALQLTEGRGHAMRALMETSKANTK